MEPLKVNMTKGAKIGLKVYGFFLILVFSVFLFGAYMMLTKVGYTIPSILMSIFLALLFLYGAGSGLYLILKKASNEITLTKEKLKIETWEGIRGFKVKDIKKIRPYYSIMKRNQGLIGEYYILFESNKGNLFFNWGYYNSEELLALIRKIKEINPSIEDDFSQCVKYGAINVPYFYDFLKQMEKENQSNPIVHTPNDE